MKLNKLKFTITKRKWINLNICFNQIKINNKIVKVMEMMKIKISEIINFFTVL